MRTLSGAPRRLLPDRDTRTAIPEGAVLARSDAQAIIERTIALSTAEGITVTLNSNHSTNLRFAANQMSTSGAVTNMSVTVESAFGPKHAAVVTNDLSADGLRRTVQQSEALAKLAPDDPEAMPALGPQQYSPVGAWFDTTADLSADARARAALAALQPARATGDINVAGFLVVTASSSALGNKAGLFGYHRSTNANYTITARTADGTGSGWAGAQHNDWSKIDVAAVSQRAIDKARLSRNPVAVEPGRYTVILEPRAVGDLVQLVGFYADARSADEGRSPFVKQGGGNKIGEKIVDQRVTLYSDPADPATLTQPFDGDGLPLARQTWIENGVLKQLYYSRFWAQKQGKQATGAPTSFIMSGGDSTVEQMIRDTPRGILVTRLWYLREVDPRTILYTGLTRDGTFLIENGKISKAIRNFRFNDSPLFMLNNIEALGRPQRLPGDDEDGGALVFPPLKVRDFSFTSLSDAV